MSYNKIPNCGHVVENGIAIALHCDAGEIMTNQGIRAKIGICGAPGRKGNGGNKNDVYLGGIPIDFSSGKGPWVATSSCAGEIHSAFYSCNTARFLKNLATGLIFGKEGVAVETIVGNDNFVDVEHVHAINSLKNDRGPSSFLEGNRGSWIQIDGYH